ncbi:MAG: beta-ketoacyl synthase N-terminal-like domain-containing protein [Acidobacteriota bacterium]
MNNISSRIEQLSPLKRALLELEEMQAKIEALESLHKEPIAIIGLGCRFPGGADNPTAFWQLLHDGRDAIKEVPSERWNVDTYYNANGTLPGKMNTRWGGFLDQVDQFDASFFGISAREAIYMDPQQRLFLEVAWEALEDAGQDPTKLAGSRTGVFVGVYNIDYLSMQLANVATIDTYSASGVAHSIVANRLSYLLDLRGPSVAIDTACSSSLVAVHFACQSIRNKECDLAIVGGVNLILSPFSSIITAKVLTMAADGRCKTFDARADGIVRSEGCGVLVFKRLSDALANHDNILALIRGSAINQDGHSSGLTSPNLVSQQAVIRQALDNAGIQPYEISYVEAHGTGTPLGDPIEIEALASIIGDGFEEDHYCAIGSVKTNLGHLEAAAGIAGLIKVVLSLQYQAIPPNLHFQQLNPHIQLERLPFIIPTQLLPWQSNGRRRLAGVSSFGLGGTNAHVIVEESPANSQHTNEPPHHLQVFTLSAKSPLALRALATRYHSFLTQHPSTALTNICFTANTGRKHFAHRLAVTVESTQQLHEQLAAFLNEQPASELTMTDTEKRSSPKIAFLFTGQGAQYPEMGRRLYETEPTFRNTINRCDELLRPYLAQPLLSILYPEINNAALLQETAYTQPALFALEYALAELWRSWGIVPDAVIGHSLGEYVAACVAGVFSLSDALKLVAERGRLIQQLSVQGMMATVYSELTTVVAAIAPYHGQIAIAAINGPENIVISGSRDAIEVVLKDFAAQEISVKILPISYPFHSPLLAPILDEFEQLTSQIEFNAATITMVSNLTGQIWQSADIQDKKYWRRHLEKPVQFLAGMRCLAELGCNIFIEIGPQTTLLELGRYCLPYYSATWLPSLNKHKDDRKVILNTLKTLYTQQAEIDWASVDRNHQRHKLSLPTYPWQRTSYWLTSEMSLPLPSLSEPLSRWQSITTAGLQQAQQCPIDLALHTYQAKWQCLDQLAVAHIVNCLLDLAAYRQTNERYCLDELMQYCHIYTGYRLLMLRWLKRLVAEGLLTEQGEYFVNLQPLNKIDLAPIWQQAKTLCADFPVLSYIENCVDRLATVLTGQQNAIETLFPGGSFEIAENVYQHWAGARYFNNIARTVIESVVKTLAFEEQLSILEVGAGIGGTTASLLPALPSNRASYYYTDVSNIFFVRAQDKFKEYPFVHYALLNIEENPQQQGLPVNCFDIVVAANVLHATRDLSETLTNVRSLLKAGGLLLLYEATSYKTVYDISIALIEGWDRHNDEFRYEIPLLSAQAWQNLLLSNGFEKVLILPELATATEILGYHILIAQLPSSLQEQTTTTITKIADAETITNHANNDGSLIRLSCAQLLAHLPEERQSLLQSYLREEIATIMRIPPAKLDSEILYKDLGLESLMAIEMRNRIKFKFGVTIHLEEFPDLNIIKLATRILKLIETRAISPTTTYDFVENLPINKTISIEPEKPTVSQDDSWITHRVVNPHADIRLFCFSYAGGSAVSFRDWHSELPAFLEVCPIQLPGRGGRLQKPVFKRVAPLVKELARVLMPYLDIPFAFFGHSLGALISFELVRQLRRLGVTLPTHLFVSSRSAPQLPDENPPVHRLTDQELIEELSRYRGLPVEVLKEPDLLKIMLPTLRADFEIIDTYVYAHEESLTCPIIALGGQQDDNVKEHQLDAWRDQTSSTFSLQMFSGDHFYWQQEPKPLLQLISQKLEQDRIKL